MDLLELSYGLGAEAVDLGPRGFLRFISSKFGTLLVHFSLPGCRWQLLRSLGRGKCFVP